ncbi:MAG: hypothetical protein DRJ34_04745, partial [Thermoprotei archaeon]
ETSQTSYGKNEIASVGLVPDVTRGLFPTLSGKRRRQAATLREITELVENETGSVGACPRRYPGFIPGVKS